MISLERLHTNEVPWHELDQYKDRTVFQTQGWVNFIAEAQTAEPIIAAIKEDGRILGYFTGLIVEKLGVKILGSPFSGWTTTYMGFNLLPGIKVYDVLEVLSDFSFNELGCRVIQLSERRFADIDFKDSSYSVINYRNLEIDLSNSEQELLSNMATSYQKGIRKASKLGVTIEEASNIDFADDYCAQLQDVFAKSSLVPIYNINRVRSLIKNVYPSGNLLLLRARSPDGECIATGIFPAFNDTMITWGSASWRKYQKFRPNEYLKWYAMRYWKTRGMTTFNLGGWSEYKKQFGGKQIRGVILVKTKPAFVAMYHMRAKKFLKQYRKIAGRFKVPLSS